MSWMETTIIALRNIGFFQFLLPFALSAAIFYGLLKKSKIFGEPKENVAVNATVALAIAFFIWAYPVLLGVNIETQIAKFMFLGFVGLISGIMIVSLISIFGGETLKEFVKEKSKLFIVIGISATIIIFSALVNSGLASLFLGPTQLQFQISESVIAAIVLAILFGLAAGIFLLIEKGSK